MISPSQRPLPDNTQHSQQTNIQALGGIRTHDRSRHAAVDLRLRPRGHWDRTWYYEVLIHIYRMETHEHKFNTVTVRTSCGNTAQEEVKRFLCLMR